MTFKITLLTDSELEAMAAAWVRGLIYSEKHVYPYRKDLVMAVFPAAKELCSTPSAKAEIDDNCGLIFELRELADKHHRVTLHQGADEFRMPIFRSVKFLHKNQVEGLQRAIDAERLRVKWLAGNGAN